MRRPVYEPGPQLTATASSGMAWLSANEMASSINVPSLTAWFGPLWSSLLNMQAPSWLTATEHTLVLVSIFKIHDIIKNIFLNKVQKYAFFRRNMYFCINLTTKVL